jgi:hypothetical protein
MNILMKLELPNIQIAPYKQGDFVRYFKKYEVNEAARLRRDKQEIFRAAAQAQKACDYSQEKALKAEERAVMSGGSVKRQPVVSTPDAGAELVNQHQPALPARAMR